MDIDRYNKIAKNKKTFKDVGTPSFLPEIIKSQYNRGYIERTFIQKANDTNSAIFEIPNDTSSKYINNPFYICVTLDWRLAGDPIDIKKSNRVSLQIASEVIPKISLYLPNLLQFYKK